MDKQAILIAIFVMFIDTMVLFFYLNCHTIKESKRLQAISAYSLYFLINCILGSIDFPLLCKAICNICMVLAIRYFNYDKVSRYEIGKEAIVFILLLGISEVLILPLIFLLTKSFDMDIFNDYSRPNLWLISMGLSRIIALCLFMLNRKIQKRNYEKLDEQEILILYLPLLISFVSFLVIAKILLGFDDFEKDDFLVLLAVIACILVVFPLLHMIFFEKYIHYRNKDQELSMLKQKDHIQYEYYQNQIETFENIRIMHHDLKNQMLVSTFSPTYMEKTKETLSQFEKFSDTGNRILDILLWKKSNEANKLGIELESDIEKVDLNFIDDMDICSIAGNILDNAIEACSEIDRNQIPKISVRLSKINNFVIFKIENDCIGSIRKKQRENVFETTKAEKKMHGIGLNSITHAVEKYNGNCEFECMDNKFLTEILIPIIR
ncbi:ATP-binding protein [Lacrimispora sp. BS-2]|uniref:ATP-binding protein n=1 Tax=Lacrimispora sp. BS-2 TaxID=3151850 RepID=A0AAU7PMD1_9FIRM